MARRLTSPTSRSQLRAPLGLPQEQAQLRAYAAEQDSLLQQRQFIREQLKVQDQASRELRKAFTGAKRRLWATAFGLGKGPIFLAWRETLKSGQVEKQAQRRLLDIGAAAVRVVQSTQRGRLAGGLTAGRSVLDRAFLGWRMWATMIAPVTSRLYFLRSEGERLHTECVDERLRQEELVERIQLHKAKADRLLSQHREARQVGDLLAQSLEEQHQALASEVHTSKAQLDLLWRSERNLLTETGALNTCSMAQMLLSLTAAAGPARGVLSQ